MYRVINNIKSKARVIRTESPGFVRVIVFYHLERLERRVSEVHIESALTEICVPAEPVVVIISYASESLFAVGADCLIEYITHNPNTFRMIFSPHNTSALRYKFFNMLEGIFRVIHTENSSAALNDVGLDYLSAYWTSGFMAVIGKWVSSSFSESEEFIIYMLKGFDESIQDHMTNFSKSKYNE